MAIVLVTRSQPEAEATALRVRALGHDAIVSPVLEIEAVSFQMNAAGLRALVFTSAAAVRAASSKIDGLRALPVFAVGDATAGAARAVGFSDVRSADGVGADLVTAVKAALPPGAGAIGHLRAEHVAGDIAGLLRSAGYDVRETIGYRAARASVFTPAALAALRGERAGPDSILFHSARGAESFVQLVREAAVERAASGLSALCLSERVAQSAKTLAWREIHVAPAPREDALLSLLGSPGGERA